MSVSKAKDIQLAINYLLLEILFICLVREKDNAIQQKLNFVRIVKTQVDKLCESVKKGLKYKVCVEAFRPSQQLMSCRAGQLPINTVPGRLRPSKRLTST